MKKIFALLFLLALQQQLFAQQADLILTGGNIITLKQKGNRAQALAIAGGKILAVGSNTDMLKYAGKTTRIVKLNGKTVIPGFNDVHQHPAPVYPFTAVYATIRCDTVTSMKNLIALIKRKAAITLKGMLIRGVGYNETNLGGQPIRDSLDKATKDHPVLISHVSGHLSAANSYLMDRAGVDENTKDPAGGLFERYPGTNKPDGICKEAAADYLRCAKITQAPQPIAEQEMEGYRRYFNQVLASGVTSIGDAHTSPDRLPVYHKLVAEHFPMRFNLIIWGEYLDQVLSGKIPKTETDFLRIATVKTVHGNSLSGKTCWLNPDNIRNIKVRTTIVNGKIAYQAK